MIKYFKELEYPNDYYMDLIEYNRDLISTSRVNKTISPEYLDKIIKLIKIINDYDLLYDQHLKVKPMYLGVSEYDYDYPYTYGWYIEGHDTTYSGLTKSGVDKLDYLKGKYMETYKGIDFKHDFFEYYVIFMDYLKYLAYVKFEYPKDIVTEYEFEYGIFSPKFDIKSYLNDAYRLALLQNKVTKEDKKLFDDVLNYLHNSKIKLEYEKPYREFNYHLANAWYITPYNHLYNTMNIKGDGHQEANLEHPFQVVFDDEINKNTDYDGYRLLRRAIETLDKGYITRIEYGHYTNLIPEFISILPEEYYNMADIDKSTYISLYRKTYNPRIVKIVAGIISAQAGLFTKFQYIKEHSSDYTRDLEFIRKFSRDEILVRCCGFHKVSSVVPKTITTSDLNYQEDFKEYIEKGWTIDFVKPIVLNYEGRLEELNDDFIKIKTFRK